MKNYMERKMPMIENYISSATLTDWILCLVIVLLALWKAWPAIWLRIKSGFNTARYGADLVDMVNDHQEAIYGDNGINDKLERDFNRLSVLEKRAKVSTEENGLIMKSMLAILKIMNKLEPSVETEQVQEEIVEFMNRQSHTD